MTKIFMTKISWQKFFIKNFMTKISRKISSKISSKSGRFGPHPGGLKKNSQKGVIYPMIRNQNTILWVVVHGALFWHIFIHMRFLRKNFYNIAKKFSCKKIFTKNFMTKIFMTSKKNFYTIEKIFITLKIFMTWFSWQKSGCWISLKNVFVTRTVGNYRKTSF